MGGGFFYAQLESWSYMDAVYFASNLPHLTWQPSDVDTDISGIGLWLDEAGLTNINDPINLDVNELPWEIGDYDGVFTANTLHIMAKPEIQNLFHATRLEIQDQNR